MSEVGHVMHLSFTPMILGGEFACCDYVMGRCWDNVTAKYYYHYRRYFYYLPSLDSIYFQCVYLVSWK